MYPGSSLINKKKQILFSWKACDGNFFRYFHVILKDPHTFDQLTNDHDSLREGDEGENLSGVAPHFLHKGEAVEVRQTTQNRQTSRNAEDYNLSFSPKRIASLSHQYTS